MRDFRWIAALVLALLFMTPGCGGGGGGDSSAKPGPSQLFIYNPGDFHTLSLSWTTPPGGNPDSYEIERSVNRGAFSTIATRSGLNTEYYYSVDNDPDGALLTFRVRAVVGGKAGSWSPEGTFQMWVRAPENLQARFVLASPSHSDLSWTRKAIANTAVRLERRITNGTWSTLQLLGPSQESYTDSTVQEGESYEYRVSNEVQSLASGFATSTIDIPLLAPVNLQAVPRLGGGARITWQNLSSHSTSLRVLRALQLTQNDVNGQFDYVALATLVPSETSFEDPGANLIHYYSYRVEAVGTKGTSRSAGVDFIPQPAMASPVMAASRIDLPVGSTFTRAKDGQWWITNLAVENLLLLVPSGGAWTTVNLGQGFAVYPGVLFTTSGNPFLFLWRRNTSTTAQDLVRVELVSGAWVQTVLLSVPGLTAAPGGMAMAGISGRGIVLAPLLNNQFAYFYESLSGWVVQAIPPATSTLYWAADIDANNQPLLAAFIPGLGTRLIRRKEDGTWLSEMIPLELPPSRGMDLMAYPDGRVLFIVGAGSSDSSYELEWFERTTSGYWNLIAHITNPSGLSSPGIYPSPDRSTVTVLAFASPYYKSAIRLHPGGVWTGGTLGPALDNLTAVSAFSTPEGRFGVLSRGFINTSAKGTRPFVLYLESP